MGCASGGVQAVDRRPQRLGWLLDRGATRGVSVDSVVTATWSSTHWACGMGCVTDQANTSLMPRTELWAIVQAILCTHDSQHQNPRRWKASRTYLDDIFGVLDDVSDPKVPARIWSLLSELVCAVLAQCSPRLLRFWLSLCCTAKCHVSFRSTSLRRQLTPKSSGSR